MNKARRIGPVLIMLAGALLLFAPSGTASSLDVGSTQIDPCIELPPVEGGASVQAATDPKCCQDPVTIGIAVPCETSSTTESTTTTSTTSTTAPTTTEPSTETTAPASTTTAPPTTTTVRVGSGQTVRPGVLARTGSNTAPMTAAGVALLVLGAGLAVAGRRRTAQA